jgi:replicative DNA helicase
MGKLPDGSPEWLPLVEERLVGAALLSFPEHVTTSASVATPNDFRDPVMGMVWGAMMFLVCPCPLHVAEALEDNNEFHRAGGLPMLVELTRHTSGFLYANEGLESHAALVRREGERRRAVAKIVSEANEKIGSLGNRAYDSLYDRPEFNNLDGEV